MSASPPWMHRSIAILAVLLPILIAPRNLPAAEARWWRQPHDYYSNDSRTRHLLEMVERYHIKPGTEKMERRAYHYAKQDFQFILTSFPNDPKALLLMGELAIKTGNPKKAIPYFQTAIRLFPNRSRTYTAYGVFLHRIGKLKQAVAQYGEALRLDPTSAETHYDLGLAYLALHDYALANKHAHIAYRLGYPLPGLQEKLRKLGKWKPVAIRPGKNTASETSSPRDRSP